MYTAEYSSSIEVVRVEGSVVGVLIISFFIHESQPGMGLLLMYKQKGTAVYCCVQPSRAAAGERRRASDGGRAMDVHRANTAAVWYTSRGESCRSTQNSLFYSRESPPGVVLLY